MIFLRAASFYFLVLLMLPWGAFVAAAQPHEINTNSGFVAVNGNEPSFIAPKPKRCRIAILTGTSCTSDASGPMGFTVGVIRPAVDADLSGLVLLPTEKFWSKLLEPPRFI